MSKYNISASIERFNLKISSNVLPEKGLEVAPQHYIISALLLGIRQHHKISAFTFSSTLHN